MLVASSLFLILSAALGLPGARAECDQGVISKIIKMWNGSPPTAILKQMGGRNTYLYTASFENNTQNLKCVQSVYDEAQSQRTSASDFYFTKTPEDDVMNNQSYVVVENDGTLLYVLDPSVVDFTYTVYFKNGVRAYYQCRHDCDYLFDGCSYKSFVSRITVHISDPRDCETNKGMAQAMKRLDILGIPPPTKINVDCETYD